MSKVDLYPQIDSSPQLAKVQTGTLFPVEKKVAADVNVLNQIDVTGEFSVSGLREAIRTTTMTVSDTAIPLPAVALTNRNSITIVNFSTTEILYIGNSNVTADRVVGVTSGYEVNPGEGFNLDITDDIVLYGVFETGASSLIKVTELA
jgi:hypothetical protein